MERTQQPALIYAGIGARATPDPVLAHMTKIAVLARTDRLASHKRRRRWSRYGLRSWGAPGKPEDHLSPVAWLQRLRGATLPHTHPGRALILPRHRFQNAPRLEPLLAGRPEAART